MTKNIEQIVGEVSYDADQQAETAMKCEHCGSPAMRDWIICKRCWKIFGGEE